MYGSTVRYCIYANTSYKEAIEAKSFTLTISSHYLLYKEHKVL